MGTRISHRVHTTMRLQSGGTAGAAPASTLGSHQRLGRALLYVHRQTPLIGDAILKAKFGQLISAGEAMDFAVKLKDHGNSLTDAMAVEFAAHADISQSRLFSDVLPKLKAADLVTYALDLSGVGLASIEEFVGLSGRIIDQAMRITEKFMPTEVELAVLHSTELASWAPLAFSQQAEVLHKRGFRDE